MLHHREIGAVINFEVSGCSQCWTVPAHQTLSHQYMFVIEVRLHTIMIGGLLKVERLVD
jgi:hypothetical protein